MSIGCPNDINLNEAKRVVVKKYKEVHDQYLSFLAHKAKLAWCKHGMIIPHYSINPLRQGESRTLYMSFMMMKVCGQTMWKLLMKPFCGTTKSCLNLLSRIGRK